MIFVNLAVPIVTTWSAEHFTRYCSQSWVCEQFQGKTAQILDEQEVKSWH